MAAWRVVDDTDGIYVEPCGHPQTALPENPVAAYMMAITAGNRTDPLLMAHGTVVWLAAAWSDDGCHTSATDAQIA